MGWHIHRTRDYYYIGIYRLDVCKCGARRTDFNALGLLLHSDMPVPANWPPAGSGWRQVRTP